MAMKLLLVFGLIILFLNSLTQRVVASEQGNGIRTYIVHVKEPDKGIALQSDSEQGNLVGWYESFLPPTTASSLNQPRMIHAYRHVGPAFAARLTPQEAQDMASKRGVLMVHEEKILRLHTTHSPSFLGLHQEQGLWRESNLGKGVIIGVFDSGIWPSHPSFNDDGMPPPPAKWKGKCDFGREGCNKKIIGAITIKDPDDLVTEEIVPPYDVHGHGTHTASTAAGNFVANANILDNANGTAAGMAPRAHLAIYRVCNKLGACPESSILAAFDIAIEDGVDIISLSIGGESSTSFFSDMIAVGSFGATKKGILVSASAGNSGPRYGTVSNEAPWLLSVGASTMDRRIVASVKLGNGAEFDGESLFQPQLKDGFSPSNSLFPLVHLDAGSCYLQMLIGSQVKGKIVLCVTSNQMAESEQAAAVALAGGAAMIMANSDTFGYTTIANKHPLPATHVSHAARLEIIRYINSTSEPEATIMFKGTVIGENTSYAPVVAYFSSRGPSLQSPGILKPDIIGPGVNVLAAWPDNPFEGTIFSMLSGTSMACPHLSGIAALLKSSHPNWSPSAIKSAMMTTAYATNIEGNPIADERLLPASLFAIGAGHVNPSRANDPGLVYDMDPDDYTGYLCGLGFTNTQVGFIMKKGVNCSMEKKVEATELNYPSFSVLLGSSPQTYTRTVTNVGPAHSTYRVKVVPPSGVHVSVEPRSLVFNNVQERARYSVTFRGASNASFAQGSLEWFSDKYFVKSPISVTFLNKSIAMYEY